MVCRPFLSAEFPKYFMRLNILVTVLILILILSNGVFTGVGFYLGKNYCEDGIFMERYNRSLIGGTLFYFLPAVVCIVLYTLVGRVVRNMKQEQERNKQLTVIFFLSCMLWLLLWLPERVFGIYFEHSNPKEYSDFLIVFCSVHLTSTLLFSLIQPLLMILSYKPLLEPILTARSKIKNFFTSSCGQGFDIANFFANR